MSHPCSLEEFITFIREEQRIPEKRKILESTTVEADLGITGDDGNGLLMAIQRRFAVSFVGADRSIREAFGLENDQYLFHGDGLFPLKRESIKPLTIGELYRVTCQASVARME